MADSPPASELSVHPGVSQDTVDDIKDYVGSDETKQVTDDVVAVFKETKNGFKTTEFWLTLAGLAAVNLNGVVMTLPDRYQAIASAVLAGLYALSRGQAKKGVPHIEKEEA